MALAVSATWVPAHAQEKSSAVKAGPAPKRDLSGVWIYENRNTGASVLEAVPEKDMPPMTAWAKAKFDANKPGHGSRTVLGDQNNDPILQCDPSGFPRLVAYPTAFEFVQSSDRIFQFFEQEHAYRPIWTDGRPLPEDPDPIWSGYSIGHWEGDTTLVVETIGVSDKTWLGSAGYPHSDQMRVTERYQRVDKNTIKYDLRIDDPKAYTKPIVAPPKFFVSRTDYEIPEIPCVWSVEQAFKNRIRAPGAAPGVASSKTN
jgi:hypothetical protein